jgi:superfamily I DNA and/or RNA helicase
MNVSLSRARLCSIVVGDAKQLSNSRLWNSLVTYAIKINACYQIPDNNYQKFFETIA